MITIASDVERISQVHYVTGIQRVLFEFHKGLLETESLRKSRLGCYVSPGSKKSENYLTNFDLAKDAILNSNPIPLDEIDVLYILDFNPKFNFSKLFAERENRKIKVISLIHDIFPLTNTEWFPKENSKISFWNWLQSILNVSDELIFTSMSTMNAVKNLDWKTQARFNLIPLGATNLSPTVKHYSPNPPTIIVVSTIEPRKGFLDILDAFDALREDNRDYRLYIVGREGWNCKEIVQRITKHKDFGQRLRWMDDLTDSDLSAVYNNSTIAVCASFNEGFGLSLEEALSRQIKVVARDIPVFRERKYKNVYYFDSNNAPLSKVILAAESEDWIWPNNEKLRTMKEFVNETIALMWA